MKKKNNLTLVVTSIICLIPVFISLMFYKEIPDKVVTHWNFAGEPDGYSSKFFAVFFLPLILLALNLLLPTLIKMDPKYENIQNKTLSLVQWIIPFVCLIAGGSTLSYALGYTINVALIMKLFVGIVIIVIGNYLPKMSQSYTVGIKLPWTLDSEDNWNKTHRFAGFLWVVCGFIFLLISLIDVSGIAIILLLLIIVLVPTAYSYLLYRKSK